MNLGGRLLRGLLRSVTLTIAPLAVLVSVNAALLAGQAGTLLSAGAASVVSATELGGEQDVAAQLALRWQEQHDNAALESADLEAAFSVLVETDEFLSETVEAARGVGDAWDNGSAGVWTVDLSSAVEASQSELDPSIASQISERAVVQSGPWVNPGADKLPTIAIVAAILAIGLGAAAVLIPGMNFTRYLWPLALFSAVQLVMLSRAANSSDPVSAALGGWLQDRLQLATTGTLLIGIAAVLLVLRTRQLA